MVYWRGASSTSSHPALWSSLNVFIVETNIIWIKTRIDAWILWCHAWFCNVNFCCNYNNKSVTFIVHFFCFNLKSCGLPISFVDLISTRYLYLVTKKKNEFLTLYKIECCATGYIFYLNFLTIILTSYWLLRRLRNKTASRQKSYSEKHYNMVYENWRHPRYDFIRDEPVENLRWGGRSTKKYIRTREK